MKRLAAAAVAILFAVQPVEAQRRSPPQPIGLGACALTRIANVTQRLEDGVTGRVIPGSGSAVAFANGHYQVSYDQVPAVNRSRRGDAVYICLVKLPVNCPPGDRRGRIYTTTNLRTLESWTLPDSQHSCGGA